MVILNGLLVRCLVYCGLARSPRGDAGEQQLTTGTTIHARGTH